METNELLIQIAFWAYVLLDGVAVTLAAIPFLHMLQLESYQGPMYLKWVRKHLGQWSGPFLAGVAGFLLRIAGQFFPGGFGTLLGRGRDLYRHDASLWDHGPKKSKKGQKTPALYR